MFTDLTVPCHILVGDLGTTTEFASAPFEARPPASSETLHKVLLAGSEL